MPRWRLNVRHDIFVRWQKLQGALVWRYPSCDPGLVAVWVGACRRPADILYLSISFRYETSARKPQERIGLLTGVRFPRHCCRPVNADCFKMPHAHCGHDSLNRRASVLISPLAVLYCRSHHPHVVAIKGSLKNGFLLFFLRSVSPVPRNTQGIILYTWELLIPYRCP